MFNFEFFSPYDLSYNLISTNLFSFCRTFCVNLLLAGGTEPLGSVEILNLLVQDRRLVVELIYLISRTSTRFFQSSSSVFLPLLVLRNATATWMFGLPCLLTNKSFATNVWNHFCLLVFNFSWSLIISFRLTAVGVDMDLLQSSENSLFAYLQQISCSYFV